MNTRHINMCRLAISSNSCCKVPVAQVFNAMISFPAISTNSRSFLHIVQNKLIKVYGRYIRNNRHSYSAWTLSSSHNRRVFLRNATRRTNEVLRPPELRNISKAGIFSAKPFIKFLECSRRINSTNWVLSLFHSHILHVVPGWVNRIPS